MIICVVFCVCVCVIVWSGTGKLVSVMAREWTTHKWKKNRRWRVKYVVDLTVNFLLMKIKKEHVDIKSPHHVNKQRYDAHEITTSVCVREGRMSVIHIHKLSLKPPKTCADESRAPRFTHIHQTWSTSGTRANMLHFPPLPGQLVMNTNNFMKAKWNAAERMHAPIHNVFHLSIHFQLVCSSPWKTNK